MGPIGGRALRIPIQARPIDFDGGRLEFATEIKHSNPHRPLFIVIRLTVAVSLRTHRARTNRAAKASICAYRKEITAASRADRGLGGLNWKVRVSLS